MNIPQPAWAVMLAILGVICAIVGYIFPGDITSRTAMFTVANSLISGALGAFAGHLANSSTSTGPNATINNPGSTFPDSK
jgi:uncharacterized membrane protein